MTYHNFSFLTLFGRLAVALLAGGAIGYGRSRRQRDAGLRTFMLVSCGAALTILLALYENEMLQTDWLPVVKNIGLKFDGSRYASSVLSGIGFLGAGTILSDPHQQVHGLSTATGLFASAAMGMAAGAGYYPAVLLATFLIILTLEFLYPLELGFKRRVRNLSIHVEYRKVEDIGDILDVIRGKGAKIFEVETTADEGDEHLPAAVLVMRLSKEAHSHSDMLTSIAELPSVRSIQELIS